MGDNYTLRRIDPLEALARREQAILGGRAFLLALSESGQRITFHRGDSMLSA
jgi:hypothetical protein